MISGPLVKFFESSFQHIPLSLVFLHLAPYSFFLEMLQHALANEFAWSRRLREANSRSAGETYNNIFLALWDLMTRLRRGRLESLSLRRVCIIGPIMGNRSLPVFHDNQRRASHVKRSDGVEATEKRAAAVRQRGKGRGRAGDDSGLKSERDTEGTTRSRRVPGL
jgi:hypothetical protein